MEREDTLSAPDAAPAGGWRAALNNAVTVTENDADQELEAESDEAEQQEDNERLAQDLANNDLVRAPNGEIVDLSDPETVSEVLADAGYPERVEDYVIREVAQKALTKDDAPAVESFLTALHGALATQAVVDAALGWYADHVAAQEQARFDLDTADRTTMVAELKDEWGADYEKNLKSLRDGLKSLGELGDALVEARMPDGHLLLNHPHFATTFLEFTRSEQGSGGQARSPKNDAARQREIEKVRPRQGASRPSAQDGAG